MAGASLVPLQPSAVVGNYAPVPSKDSHAVSMNRDGDLIYRLSAVPVDRSGVKWLCFAKNDPADGANLKRFAGSILPGVWWCDAIA